MYILLFILIYGIILWWLVSISRPEDAKHCRLCCWTYRLSTIVELVTLGLSFAVQSRRRESCDEVHIGIAFIRTALLGCVISMFERPGSILFLGFYLPYISISFY